ncbi:hypothetical protein O7614_10415 [Micromonospora sp. WMMD961]|uniref:hypothetical protein n=1 Tax=Micromonospora sp. WMMD961 TaxID=3016100 RepID=UPI0024180768|nr:hypothetical protein [Micromonospora sp. WMMD961]MDG4780053.1 hypothetical protein [Micromonospora sp. WMMD961]
MPQIDLQQTYRHSVRRLEIPADASDPGTTCLTNSTSTGRSRRTAQLHHGRSESSSLSGVGEHFGRGDLFANLPPICTVIAVTGAALTAHAWSALHQPNPNLIAAAGDGGPVTPPLLDMIDTVVAHAQQLDDHQGGAAREFVSDQFSAVARLLRRASYNAEAGRRLASALAQLAQTAGFMAFDANEDGLAQRWYLTALRAAHAARDPGLAASILALMSNQAADRGHALDALQLASAAQESAAKTPPAVRSLVAARSSLAHAVAGDLTSFFHMRENTLALLGTAPDAPLPRWASYIDRVELDAITGRGLVVLAERVPIQRPRLLRQAERLLYPRAHTSPTDSPQRSALRHGAWLSLAHNAAGDLDLAVSTARLALGRLPAVSSVRSVALLHRLHDELAPAAPRLLAVRDILRELRELPRTTPAR